MRVKTGVKIGKSEQIRAKKKQKRYKKRRFLPYLS